MVLWGRKLQLVHRNSLKHIQRQREEIERGGLGEENRQKPLHRTVTPFSTVLGAGLRPGDREGTREGLCREAGEGAGGEQRGKCQEPELGPMPLSACYASRVFNLLF